MELPERMPKAVARAASAAKDNEMKAIQGTIIRAEVLDRVDGGTLYYFRDDKTPKGK